MIVSLRYSLVGYASEPIKLLPSFTLTNGEASIAPNAVGGGGTVTFQEWLANAKGGTSRGMTKPKKIRLLRS
jgi:hypothetical protein